MKIYVASSWRNPWQPGVVTLLRELGHEVYDYREPAPGCKGFGWSEIDPEWKRWSPSQFKKSLRHPLAENGFMRDIEALMASEACILVQPCGTSAHLELGFAIGAGKRTAVLYPIDIPTPSGVDEHGKPRNPTDHTLNDENTCPACSRTLTRNIYCVRRAQLFSIEPELMLKAAGEILLSEEELLSWLRWEERSIKEGSP